MSAAIRKCPKDKTLRNARSKLDVIVHISKLYITSRHYEEIWLFNHKIGQSGPLTEDFHLIISIISTMSPMTYVEEAVLNSVVPKMKPLR